LNTLTNDSIGSWGELESQFARNFRSTYKHPASLEEVKSCVQRKDETLHSYIQRWSVIKNSVEDVSDERAIDAFSAGLRRATQETPFFLVHGAEVVLPVEITHEAPRITAYDETTSTEALQDDVDALDGARDVALARATQYQQNI
jgi:hypothetical protein